MTPTDRLYYTDALRTTFDAIVVSAVVVDGQPHVTLDATAFYPSSGGQPFDTGTLGGRQVVDVRDGADGLVAHVLDGPLDVGQAVSGVIDWPRRFDHMQQHTGQHILSAAFEHTCGARTESVHLGTTSCTIDLAREVSAREIAAAEDRAAAVVFEDRPVRVRFVSEQEAATLPLRKDPSRAGTIRLVEVDDFDLSACGGTHVPSTGRVGMIAVTGWERFKGGSRVAFACGHRALAEHGRLRDLVTELVRQMTVAPADLGSTVERLQSEARRHVKTIRLLREEAAGHEAVALVAAAERVGTFRRVITSRPGWEMGALKTLASAIVAHSGCVAVIAGHDTPVSEGTPVSLVVARSADVSFDSGAWVKRVTTELGGRGGGRSESAQGVVSVPLDKVLTFARATVQ
ncbi:MAG: alanyl-tRNA editing protein [Acidobacteria bacterium]|nr:alanyl-tRNA editing protein [Acidobacteriota bacterium]